jgi:hypothetical protein
MLCYAMLCITDQTLSFSVNVNFNVNKPGTYHLPNLNCSAKAGIPGYLSTKPKSASATPSLSSGLIRTHSPLLFHLREYLVRSRYTDYLYLPTICILMAQPNPAQFRYPSSQSQRYSFMNFTFSRDTSFSRSLRRWMTITTERGY